MSIEEAPATLTAEERARRRQAADRAAHKYASEHLKACCAELSYFGTTGIMEVNHMRHLAQIFVDAGAHGNGMPEAKDVVHHLAVTKVANLPE